MKRVSLVLAVVILLFGLAGCGSNAADDVKIEGELQDLVSRIYEIYNAREDVKYALAEIEDIGALRSELSEIIYAPDNGLSEGEIAELQAELDELQQLYNELSKFRIPFTFEQDLTQEGGQFNPISYFLGADDIPFAEGVASEAAIGAQAYSLVLLRMEANADIEAAKTKIKNGVDPMKWICAGVDPSDVIVDNLGDLVILIMADSSKALHESFLELY